MNKNLISLENLQFSDPEDISRYYLDNDEIQTGEEIEEECEKKRKMIEKGKGKQKEEEEEDDDDEYKEYNNVNEGINKNFRYYKIKNNNFIDTLSISPLCDYFSFDEKKINIWSIKKNNDNELDPSPVDNITLIKNGLYYRYIPKNIIFLWYFYNMYRTDNPINSNVIIFTLNKLSELNLYSFLKNDFTSRFIVPINNCINQVISTTEMINNLEYIAVNKGFNSIENIVNEMKEIIIVHNVLTSLYSYNPDFINFINEINYLTPLEEYIKSLFNYKEDNFIINSIIPELYNSTNSSLLFIYNKIYISILDLIVQAEINTKIDMSILNLKKLDLQNILNYIYIIFKESFHKFLNIEKITGTFPNTDINNSNILELYNKINNLCCSNDFVKNDDVKTFLLNDIVHTGGNYYSLNIANYHIFKYIIIKFKDSIDIIYNIKTYLIFRTKYNTEEKNLLADLNYKYLTNFNINNEIILFSNINYGP